MTANSHQGPQSVYTITFEPTGRSIAVASGVTLLEAATQAGLPIDAPCGGAGVCGKCRVRFVHNAPVPTETQKQTLREEELEAGWRLACQTVVTDDATVSIPDTSLFSDQLQILTQSESIIEQSAGDVQNGGPPASIPLRPGRNVAIAFDVGTTTLVGEMIDLPTGQALAVAASINPQVNFGDDVISRIARSGEGLGDELRDSVRDAIRALIDELCEETNVAATDVRAVSFAGNTTMQHLLAGWPVTSLSQLPFEPARYESLDIPASELGFSLDPDARALVFPVIGGFVGGDTVAGILSTNLFATASPKDQATGPIVMIDVGTNGEIVLAASGKLYAASAAAGPAFEGARIANGMRAAAGAIEKVTFPATPAEGDVQCSVIGGGQPIGLCGSAMIDVAAGLLDMNLLDETGRLARAESPEAGACSPALASRLCDDEKGQPQFTLVPPSPDHPGVAITQKDIRELQLATGALRAGVVILLQHVGLTPDDLAGVYIAGGFGSFIRRRCAQRIGLIPQEVPAATITYVGNVSLHGAKRILASKHAHQQANEIARTTDHVELSADLNFQLAFAEAMIFPD